MVYFSIPVALLAVVRQLLTISPLSFSQAHQPGTIAEKNWRSLALFAKALYAAALQAMACAGSESWVGTGVGKDPLHMGSML